MPVDPQIQTMLDFINSTDRPAYDALTLEQLRAGTLMQSLAKPEEVSRVDDRLLAGPDAHIAVRVYRPAGRAPFPLLVYFHGGGWVIGSLETHDSVCRALANASGCVVVSVDYRLAP